MARVGSMSFLTIWSVNNTAVGGLHASCNARLKGAHWDAFRRVDINKTPQGAKYIAPLLSVWQYVPAIRSGERDGIIAIMWIIINMARSGREERDLDDPEDGRGIHSIVSQKFIAESKTLQVLISVVEKLRER